LHRLFLAGDDVSDTPSKHTDSESSQRLLLYIEDNAANLALVQVLLERRPDLKLLSATAGYPGIELARAQLPEVIVTDINLPDIDGLALLKVLREDPATARIPVIALSSGAFPRQIEKGLEAGFFRYLTKPFQLPDFMRQLDEALHVSARNATVVS
jgi:CheY-like chemotaxis protein